MLLFQYLSGKGEIRMEKSYTYKPVRFFLIVNLVTWTTWLTAAYFSYQQGGRTKGLITVLEIIGLFAPFGASLWMIFTSNSKELKRNYYDRLINLKLIRMSSIPAIFLIMPSAVLLSVLISYLLFGQSLGQLGIDKAPFTAGLIPIPLLMLGAALVEELGWKGYGVDSLRGRRTFFTVSLIYGALWGFWHVPTFFIDGYYQNMIFKENPLYAINFMVSIMAAAFIINWLWYMNRGSILTAVLFHAVTNFQGLLQMGQIAKCIETVVFIVVAIIIICLNKKIFFEIFQPRIGDFGAKTSSPQGMPH